MHTGPIEKNIKYYSSIFQHYGQHSHNGIDDWQLVEQREKQAVER